MRPLPLILLTLLTAAVLLTTLVAGEHSLGPAALWQALTHGDGLNGRILWELRLPRALAGFVVGALLALAGVQMQVLLGNPLAEPYILGTSGGSATAALLALWAGAGQWQTGLAAFGGALASTALVFQLARGGGRWSPPRLLLTGVVVAAGWGAAVTFILSLAPSEQLHGMLFWLTGDLSLAPLPKLPSLLLGLGLAAGLLQAREMNLLARGEVVAAGLGVEVARLRLGLYLSSALLTAAAVTVGGTIGFVGLVVPHLLRLRLGSDHRLIVPAAVLAGGTLVMAADTLARTLFAPQQLPVGVLTAFIGVPLFLYLLQRGYRG